MNPGPINLSTLGLPELPIGLPLANTINLGVFGVGGAGNNFAYPMTLTSEFLGQDLYLSNLTFNIFGPGAVREHRVRAGGHGYGAVASCCRRRRSGIRGSRRHDSLIARFALGTLPAPAATTSRSFRGLLLLAAAVIRQHDGMHRTFRLLTSLFLANALAIAAGAQGQPAKPAATEPTDPGLETAIALEQTFVKIAQRAFPSVVTVTSFERDPETPAEELRNSRWVVERLSNDYPGLSQDPGD